MLWKRVLIVYYASEQSILVRRTSCWYDVNILARMMVCGHLRDFVMLMNYIFHRTWIDNFLIILEGDHSGRHFPISKCRNLDYFAEDLVICFPFPGVRTVTGRCPDVWCWKNDSKLYIILLAIFTFFILDLVYLIEFGIPIKA